MRRDLHDMERGMALGIPGQGECPGASARGCYAPLMYVWLVAVDR